MGNPMPTERLTDRPREGQDTADSLRRVDARLGALREEVDQLDAMLLYLQRQRDAAEDRWTEVLAERDRLETELWDQADRYSTEIELVPMPELPEPEREVHVVAANGRPSPPDLSDWETPPPRPPVTSLLAQWGIDEDTRPQPPDLSGSAVPSRERVGPLLEAWELEEVASPAPRYVPIADTIQICVVPGGMRRANVLRDGVPTPARLADTAPMLTLRPRALS